MPTLAPRLRVLSFGALALVLLVACAPPPPGRTTTGEGGPGNAGPQTGRRKVLNLGLRTVLDGFSIAGSGTLQGGGLGYIELHSQALFTADKTTGRPVPRLLAEQPSLDNAGLRLTDDGKMVATYRLRR